MQTDLTSSLHDRFYNPLRLLVNNLYQDPLYAEESRITASHWLPAVDIKEEANAFLIHADLPGLDEKDIDISLDKNILAIKGKREEIHRDEKKNYHRFERSRGEFYRQFSLPNSVDSENIQASFKKGVLEIKIPKKEVLKSKKIEIITEK